MDDDAKLSETWTADVKATFKIAATAGCGCVVRGIRYGLTPVKQSVKLALASNSVKYANYFVRK